MPARMERPCRHSLTAAHSWRNGIRRTDREAYEDKKDRQGFHSQAESRQENSLCRAGKEIYGEYCKLLPERKAGCSPAEKSSGAGTGIRAQVQDRSNTVRDAGDFFTDETAKSYQQEYGNASGIRDRDFAALGNLHVKRPLQEYQKESVPQGKQPEQQHQVQRPSAYHENTIKTTGSVLHRKSDVPFSIKRADNFTLKERKGKKEKEQKLSSENKAGNSSAAYYAQAFSDRRDEQISKYKRKKFFKSGKEKYSRPEAGGEKAGRKADTEKSVGTAKIPEAYRIETTSLQMQSIGEPILSQMQNNFPVDNANTSHIKKRNAGDSISQRDGNISGRKDKAGGNDKKSKKDKGKNKDTKKDNSRSNSKKRKDRAAAFRLLSYAADKFSQEEQKDSLLKVAKDLLVGKVKAAVAGKLLSIGAALLPALIPVFIVTVIITLLFNSPFSILLPKLTEDPGAVEVLAEYTEDFREKVQEELADPGSGDETELIYEDYEGDGEPDNMADILMVYMVKHGFGDTATVMTEKNRRLLKDIFDEMTSLDITYRTEIVEQSYEEEDFYGNVTIKTEEVEIKIKEVRITLLTSEDIIRTGIFTEEETEILRYLMSPEILENIEGLTGGYGSPGAGSLTPEETENLNLGGDVGSQAVKNALARLGKPYSQAKRDSGDYYDCSSLTYYSYKEAGITLSYHGSNTAASQGQLLSERGCEVAYEDIQPGDLIFYSFTRNGRYRNISHVAIYAGNGYLVDASSSKGYVGFRPVYSTGKIVMCGRPSWL